MNGINNNIAFRGPLGERFVQEITVNHRTVTANELLQASKSGFLGLDPTRVGDIFEAFTSTLIKETKEKITMKEHFDRIAQELPSRIQEAIRSTEEAIFSSVRPVLEAKDKEIQEKDKIIADLKQQLENLKTK